MANREAERLWGFVEQLKQGASPEDAGDPLLRLAGYVSEAMVAPSSLEEGRDLARAHLASVIEQMRPQHRRGPLALWFRVPRLVPIAVAAALLLFMGLLHHRSTQPSPLTATEFVKDHLELLAKQQFADFRDSDPTRVAFWLTHKVGFPVVAVDLSEAGAKLLGGRRCQIAGQPIGLSFYQRNGTRISLFQLQGKQHRPAGVEEVNVSGRRFLVGSDKGFNVVAWQGRETFCALVSGMDTQTLLNVAEAGARQTDK